MTLEAYDNKGDTYDRYTVFVHPKSNQALLLSPNCDAPNGVSMHVEATRGTHLGTPLEFESLPTNVQQHTLRRLAL